MELAVPADVPRYAFSRGEFDRLVALGFFGEARVELLYGEIVTMTMGAPHAELVAWLLERLISGIGQRASVRAQSPVAASDISEPEPDIAVVPRGRYFSDHPARALWIIEVADSTLNKDRTTKARLYAETDVPEYWVVDVQGKAIEVFSDPKNGRYQSLRRFEVGSSVSPAAFPDITIAVDALFG